ncbi:NAD-dependent epimerase/dehydratase family protein [Georgenia sp. AZ-5]|uniref:NAD-dependent epimerase/dehydratase family protein n=1 Tax=Georgenia sp. AZ-5 TaxID=3367526 RepID=UPI00375413FA
MSRHLAVFGGGRMIGPPLLHAAAQSGWQITVVNRHSPPPPGLANASHLAGDRGDPRVLEELAARAPDVVVDLSSYEPEHVEAALAALAATVQRYLLMSTAAVYAPGDLLPWTEDQPLGGDPLWGSYGEKKLTNERIAASYTKGVAITVLRAPYIVGHPDFMNRLQFIADRIAAGVAIYVPDSGRSPIQLVSPIDVAGALLHLCDVEPPVDGTPSAYNIGNAQFASLIGLVRLLAEAMGTRTPTIVPVALEAVGLGNAPFSWTDMVFPFADRPYVLDDSRLRATGFRPRLHLEALLSGFVAQYRAAGGPARPTPYPAEITAMSLHASQRGV